MIGFFRDPGNVSVRKKRVENNLSEKMRWNRCSSWDFCLTTLFSLCEKAFSTVLVSQLLIVFSLKEVTSLSDNKASVHQSLPAVRFSRGQDTHEPHISLYNIHLHWIIRNIQTYALVSLAFRYWISQQSPIAVQKLQHWDWDTSIESWSNLQSVHQTVQCSDTPEKSV